MRKIYSGEYTETLCTDLLKSLHELQKGCHARLLTDADIDCALSYVNQYQYGTVDANGGFVPKSYRHRADTTYLLMSWYTWRKVIYIYVSISREPSIHESYGASKSLNFDDSKKRAYEIVLTDKLTDRYKQYKNLKIRRQLRYLNCILPYEMLYKIFDIDAGMALVMTTTFHIFLCTPLNYYEIREKSKTVYNAAKSLGITLPHNKSKRTWDNIKPLWILKAVKGE